MSAESLIELNGVDVLREDGAEVLLRNVSWSIARGEFWVVCGPPGAGRSPLLATAAGFNRSAGGTVRIFGHELLAATEEEWVDWRRRIGFVFANGGRLFNHLTVAENVALPLEYHQAMSEGEMDARVAQFLQQTELTEHADAMPSRLSLRLQHRAGLMRALIVPTEILLLDNPLSGLGPRDVRWWSDFLRELHGRKTETGAPFTIAATCDHFRDWRELATHFALIEGDQVRLLGGREQLLANQDAAVLEFV